LGDCLHRLKQVPDQSVQLVMCSPPYAQQRRASYGGVDADHYVPWFLERAKEFQRVLKPGGTFILNLKEHADQGRRHAYVMELVLALREMGWVHTETWIWNKTTSFPGKWSNRFRNAWEPLFQFNLSRNFVMHQDAVMTPTGDWRKKPAKVGRYTSTNGSGLARDNSRWNHRDKVYPSNVLSIAPVAINRGHPAVYPVALPTFFVKLFSSEGDLVVDPFEGSGTTGLAAAKLGRRYVGVEIVDSYHRLARDRQEL
jgi:site-specific DNA-methyltransferase (adenine-specific)